MPSEATRKVFKSVWFSRTRSRQVAGDLFLWHKKHQGVYINSLTIIVQIRWELNNTFSPTNFFFHHKSSVFLSLSSNKVRWFLHQLILCPVFFLNLPLLGWKAFHQQHDSLRLISFFTGLECSHWSLGFLPQFLSLGWEVFYQISI